jgi:23S rRNA (adenine2030-N6)-methyltransferase
MGGFSNLLLCLLLHMLSYRHGYHAGNFADVFKHVVLCQIVQSLLKKEKPFVYLDTHAGAGLYKLTAGFSRRNREHESGIDRVWKADRASERLTPYVEAVRAVNPGDKLIWYPGSPHLVKHWLRKSDRMELCELHGSEVPELKSLFRGCRQIHVHHMDGYQGLKAFLPPPERRGLVFCDPPYELPDERKKLLAAVTEAWQRWPTGLYAIWYPLMGRPETDWFHRQFKRSGIKKILMCEMRVFGEDLPDRLNGSGMVLINPPWPLDEHMAELGPELARLLAHAEGEGRYRQNWLVPE